MKKFELYYRELIPIFPQAKVFKSFGINVEKQDLNICFGTSFKRDNHFLYNSFSPFDFDRVEYLEDKDIIVLHSDEFGFSLRIYFVSFKTITLDFWKSLDSKSEIKNNIKICKSGKYDKNTSSFFAYTELYASTSKSILFQLFPDYKSDYTDGFLNTLFNINNLDFESSIKSIHDIKEKESISTMNSFCIQKYDSILEREIPFFSYNALLYL